MTEERDPQYIGGVGYIYYRVGPGFRAWGVGAVASMGDEEYRAHLERCYPGLEYAGFSFVEVKPASKREPDGTVF